VKSLRPESSSDLLWRNPFQADLMRIPDADMTDAAEGALLPLTPEGAWPPPAGPFCVVLIGGRKRLPPQCKSYRDALSANWPPTTSLVATSMTERVRRLAEARRPQAMGLYAAMLLVRGTALARRQSQECSHGLRALPQIQQSILCRKDWISCMIRAVL
jgi:hypothetical protein